jgi:hypothetical protein
MATNKERYYSLKAAGICIRCGKNKTIVGKYRDKIVTCKKCREKEILKSQKYREGKNPNKKKLREARERMSAKLNAELNKM